jgi:hypothetical protein
MRSSPYQWTSRGEIPQVTVNSRRRRSQYNIKAPLCSRFRVVYVFNGSLFRWYVSWYPLMMLGDNVFYAVRFYVYCTLYINITLYIAQTDDFRCDNT